MRTTQWQIKQATGNGWEVLRTFDNYNDAKKYFISCIKAFGLMTILILARVN